MDDLNGPEYMDGVGSNQASESQPENHNIMATTLIASPRKLPNGQWGAYCASAKVGDLLTIRTAAGKEWQARVTSITDSGVCVTCTTGPFRDGVVRSTTRPINVTRTGCCCGSVEEYGKDSDCWTCRHDS